MRKSYGEVPDSGEKGHVPVAVDPHRAKIVKCLAGDGA